MMSIRVSRFTLKGMFLMTMAVGITSSSRPPMGGVDIMGVFTMCAGNACGGGDEDSEEGSDAWGEIRPSAPGVSDHDWRAVSSQQRTSDPWVLLTAGRPLRAGLLFLSGEAPMVA
jgi:hypothetical protein